MLISYIKLDHMQLTMVISLVLAKLAKITENVPEVTSILISSVIIASYMNYNCNVKPFLYNISNT